MDIAFAGKKTSVALRLVLLTDTWCIYLHTVQQQLNLALFNVVTVL